MHNRLNWTFGLKAVAITGVCLSGASGVAADQPNDGPKMQEPLNALEFCLNDQMGKEIFYMENYDSYPNAQMAEANSYDGPPEGDMLNYFPIRAKFGPNCPEILGQANIASFMQNLGANQISTIPNFLPLLTGNSAGAMDIQTSQGNSEFNMATPDGLPVWVRLQGNWSKSDQAESTYFAGTAGAHYTINSDAIVGLMLEFDSQTQENDVFKVEGSGYMVGPYFVAKLPSKPIYVEASYLVGKAENTVSGEFGPIEFEEDFDTERALGSVRVAGDLAYGDYTMTPSIAASYLKSTQNAISFADADDTPEQSITTQDVALGLDVSRSLATQHGTMVLTGGLTAIFSATDGTGFAEDVKSNFEGERARIHFGTRYALDSGIILSAATSYDGIGADDYESIGVQLQMEMSL